jgi:hypothetical protein
MRKTMEDVTNDGREDVETSPHIVQNDGADGDAELVTEKVRTIDGPFTESKELIGG